jgi:hypothetical protein
MVCTTANFIFNSIRLIFIFRFSVLSLPHAHSFAITPAAIVVALNEAVAVPNLPQILIQPKPNSSNIKLI